MALETELARAQWSQADSRDPTKTANRFTLDQLQREFTGFDWRAWANPQGIERARYVMVAQPSFFRRFAELVATTPLDTWKAWMAARYITAAAPYLSMPFETARFDFFGLELSGQEKPRLRWRRGVSLVSGYMGDALGRLYVKKHFPATARARVQRITDNVIAAFRESIKTSTWMSPQTREEALDKLSRLTTKIGYPDEWRNYRDLEIRADDLYGNIQRARKFQNDENVRNVRGVGGRFWLLTPQTVNAYYNHANNELVVTAAILQPPVFNLEADDAVNYGAIGSMIGHELGHAFDQRGRLTDSKGNHPRLVGARRREAVRAADGHARCPGLAICAGARPARQRRAHHGRKCRRSRRSVGRLCRLQALARRAAVTGHRRIHRRAAVLSRLGADLACEDA